MNASIGFAIRILVIAAIGLLGLPAAFAIQASSLQNLDPGINVNFVIRVPGYQDMHFESCTGIGSEKQVAILKAAGTDGSQITKKIPTILSSIDVVCERGLHSNPELWRWYNDVSQPGAEKYIRDITIVAQQEAMTPLGSWELKGAWPSKVVYSYKDGRLFEEVTLVSNVTERLFSPHQVNAKISPTYGANPGTSPKIEIAKGYVTAQKPFDISGTWNSSIGLTYQISQEGNKFSYQDPLMHRLVQGTIDGKTVNVSWEEQGALKWLKGSIVISESYSSIVKRVEWDNGVVFTR